MQWKECSEGLPTIDNKNPKHYVFTNNVTHQAVNIWTQFITSFPPIITAYINQWKWLDDPPPIETVVAGEGEEDVKKDAERNKVQLSNIPDQEGINITWLLLFEQFEIWYGDHTKKETGRQFIERLQSEFSLSQPQPTNEDIEKEFERRIKELEKDDLMHPSSKAAVIREVKRIKEFFNKAK